MPVLFGKYEYDPQKDKLGEGSFGSVYRCHDILLNRDYAIKISKPVAPESDRYSLISEFSRVIDFQHENIVKYFNVFRLDGINDLGEKTVRQVGVMELVEGTNLQDEFEKGIKEENLITEIALGILAGLHYLHKNGLIHRDLKPSNILLSIKDGKIIPKISDFGISKAIESSTSVGLSGVIGTFGYMAPEQFGSRDDTGKLDMGQSRISFSVDLWAFGVILYELFTGKPPFGNEKTHTQGEILNNILNSTIPLEIETILEPYQHVIKKCLQKDRRERYKSAEHILNDLTEPYIHLGEKLKAAEVLSHAEQTTVSSQQIETLPLKEIQSAVDRTQILFRSKEQNIAGEKVIQTSNSKKKAKIPKKLNTTYKFALLLAFSILLVVVQWLFTYSGINDLILWFLIIYPPLSLILLTVIELAFFKIGNSKLLTICAFIPFLIVAFYFFYDIKLMNLLIDQSWSYFNLYFYHDISNSTYYDANNLRLIINLTLLLSLILFIEGLLITFLKHYQGIWISLGAVLLIISKFRVVYDDIDLGIKYSFYFLTKIDILFVYIFSAMGVLFILLGIWLTYLKRINSLLK